VPRPRVPMRKIRDIIRLALGEGLSSARSGSHSAPVHHRRRSRPARQRGRAVVAVPRACPTTTSSSCCSRRRCPPTSPGDAGLRLRAPRAPAKGRDARASLARIPRGPPRRLRLHPVRHHYRVFRAHVDVVMRQHHRAGEKLFVDFPGMTIPILTGHRAQSSSHAELFVAVAGALELPLRGGLPSQELMHWVSGHTHAFEAMGGPRDRGLRQPPLGVTRPHRYEPDVNAPCRDGAHYGVAVIPTRLQAEGQASRAGGLWRSDGSSPAAQPPVHLARGGERRHPASAPA